MERPIDAAEPPAAEGPSGLRRFFAFQVLVECYFTGGIWILYLQHRGFSLGEIGLAEAVFHLAPIALELPSGSLADVVGRKWTLALGPFLAAISALLMIRADSLWWVLPAMFLSGASYAFRSGSTQAYLYDSLAEGEQSSRYTGMWGRLLSASYVIAAVTMWIGGVLAERDFALPWLLSAAFGLLAAGIALTLREPERETAAHRGVIGTIREAVAIVRGRPGLAWLLVFGAGVFTLCTLVGLYAQAVLAERGLPPSRIGLVLGLTFLFTAAGSWFADRIGARVGFVRMAAAITLAATAAALGLGGAGVLLALALFVISEFVTGVFEPMFSNRVNEGLPAAQRATILSIEGLLFSATMIWAFPLFGVAAERAGWLAAYAGASAVVALLLLGWVRADRRSRAAVA